MEIKNCAHCGGEAMLWSRNAVKYGFMVRCTICEVRTDNYEHKESAVDVWNGRYESDPTESDRWLQEATEQRARAEQLQMQVDELSEALVQAKRMLSYSGEEIKIYTAKFKTRKRMEETIPRHEWGWWIDVCPGKTLVLRDATKQDLSRCILKENTSHCHHDYYCEISYEGSLVNRKAVANVKEQILPMSMDQYRIVKGFK